jgi:starch-binding outer membrane protein, SusD/RagB family
MRITMKMRIKIKAIPTILLLALTITSCTDWLTVEPEGKLLKDEFWKTTEDVQAAVAAMYNSQQSVTVENMIWGEVRANLFSMGSSFSDYARIGGSNITASNGAVDWSKYYNTINLANTILYYDKQVYGNDVTFTKELKDQVDGECMFLRALNHFHLVRLWRDVPLMTTASISDTSSIFVPKSNEADILNFLIQDLKKAKNMVSDDPAIKGRANKYAIMALMADIYLWSEQYEEAVAYCDSVTMGGYSLEPNATWFNLYYPGNSAAESIFEIQFNEALHEERNPIYGSLLPVNGTAQLIPNTESLTGLLSFGDIRSSSYSNTPNPLNKYLLTSIFSGIERTTNQEDANYIYYRYADIVLIKAEALNEIGGHEDEVNDLLRMTEERAGLTYTNVSGKRELRTEILNERGREFLIEGKRWFDILRFAKRNNYENKDLITQTLLAGVNIQDKPILEAYIYDENGYYLPIPDEEILYNPNLVQNPFYDKY